MLKHVKLFEDLLPGGLGDNKPDKDFNPKQLKKGAREEKSEHTKDYRIAKEIAKDHLTEDPSYYTNEDAMDPLTGGGADMFTQYIKMKNAAIEDEHGVYDPKAGGIGQVEEDTTNPPSAGQVDNQELLANDDLSHFAVPQMNNENKTKDMNEKQSPRLKYKMKKVMGEFGSGKLKTSAGKTVTDPKQAVAIGYSEAGESKKKNESVNVMRFEQFVNESYGPKQEKMQKARQKAEKDMMKKDDKTSGQKKVTDIRKKTAKVMTESKK